jgi:hypothetical protein
MMLGMRHIVSMSKRGLEGTRDAQGDLGLIMAKFCLHLILLDRIWGSYCMHTLMPIGRIAFVSNIHAD